MQQNHCDGVLSNDWNTLLWQQISQHTAMSMSRSALDLFISFNYNYYFSILLCRSQVDTFDWNNFGYQFSLVFNLCILFFISFYFII